MRNLLWVGDAACPSGFARATHEIVDTLRHFIRVTILGINYRGDPHDYPYSIYPAGTGGDMFGVGRMVQMCDMVKPDVIVLQNDGWNLQSYIEALKPFKEHSKIPIIAVIAVDGKNFQGKQWLQGVTHAIFWTNFGFDEAFQGGYEGSASVIPLGVDTKFYHPIDKQECRERLFRKSMGDALTPEVLEVLNNAFIVGNVNRNQPRKRFDLSIKYFAKWLEMSKAQNAFLYLHVAPTGDLGVHIVQLASYYGIVDSLMLREPSVWYGVSEDEMRDTYNSFDVQINTGQGEGFGLTTFEAMACGVPNIVPNWSALGELCRNSSLLVTCSSTNIGPPYQNVLGGVPDQQMFINHLDNLYQNPELRERYGKRGLDLTHESRFDWKNIGRRYLTVLDSVLGGLESRAS